MSSRQILTVPSSSTSQSHLPPGEQPSPDSLDLVQLKPLMQLTSGRPDTTIALIDGPVATNHPDLSNTKIRELHGKPGGTCTRANSVGCMHGTFVAGILSARRGSPAPAIAPNCTLLVRPIFNETQPGKEHLPSATPEDLATAILDCVEAGAHIVNLSAALARPSAKGEQSLESALDHAARRGVIIVVASGNQGSIGSSAITRHTWVIPVVACDKLGRPKGFSNLGRSIGRRGLSAPGDEVTSLGTTGNPVTFGGTSAAAPFVTATIALLRSEFPTAAPSQLKLAVTQAAVGRRDSVIPPLLNAWAAYQFLSVNKARR